MVSVVDNCTIWNCTIMEEEEGGAVMTAEGRTGTVTVGEYGGIREKREE